MPRYVGQEFADYLTCGRVEHGFLRLRCEACQAEKLVAFSCKRRGFYPSCGAKRMVESAALLVDEVLPHEPLRLLDGAYEQTSEGLVFRRVPSPGPQQLQTLLDTLRRMTPKATPAEKRQAMSWAQRLKRVFRIDIEQCACGGQLKIIASIEQPEVIKRILDHLAQARGPPALVRR